MRQQVGLQHQEGNTDGTLGDSFRERGLEAFGLRVWTGDRRAHDEISFQFHAGDDTAGVLQ